MSFLPEAYLVEWKSLYMLRFHLFLLHHPEVHIHGNRT